MTNSSGTVAASNRTPVVLLHDAAIDEFISSMLLTVMPSVELLGIIVINADCLADAAMQASSKLMQFMGRTDIPVALSRSRGWNPFPWVYRGDCVKFNNLPILQGNSFQFLGPPPDGEDLLAQLLRTAIQTNRPLTLLMTGPMTPLVDVLSRDASLAKGVGQIVWMGGAINVAGNLDPNTIDKSVANPHAEWNAFWDPYAVANVFQQFEGINLFPLDITNTASISLDFMAALKEQSSKYRYSKLAYDAYSLVASEPFYSMWDVTATCWITRPDIYTPATPLPLM
ncbi:MAG TPA: nucleoside hydrolase, partial [Granulicella sp.]